MSSFRIRPRFRHTFQAKKEEFEELLCATLKGENGIVFDHLPGHIYIKIHPSHQHIWSPQLHLTFAQEDENLIVRGLYGPNPTLWAVFFFGYIAIGVFTFFIGMWGLTRWSLGQDSTVLWIVPALWVIGLILYFASQAGQKMGAQQMFDIHHIYETVTKNKIHVK